VSRPGRLSDAAGGGWTKGSNLHCLRSLLSITTRRFSGNVDDRPKWVRLERLRGELALEVKRMSGAGLPAFWMAKGGEVPGALVYTGGFFLLAALLLAWLGHGSFWGGVSLRTGCLVIGGMGTAFLAGGLVWQIRIWRRRRADPLRSSK
jgi:hypothetical protein